MRKLQQFFIYKISTNHLKRKNYNITLTIDDARKGGEMVSIGDSQMLRSLRKIKGIETSNDRICELVLEKRKIKHKKTDEDNNRLIEIDNELDSILFVPEIVSVLVEDVKHYEYIGKNGFTLNGAKYKRLLCGAGQARRNNSLWIDERYEKSLKDILNNGRKDIEIVPAKYSAYFALASSASLEVSKPYFCVVKDLEVTRTERVDFVEEVEGADDLVYERDMEIPFNLWDGQGIISPRKAKEWADELELDYVPSTFIIRSNFIKGMVAVIDFHKFSEEIGNHFVIDTWGNKVNIRDMDIILTQSQFKLWNAYDSIGDYLDKCKSNDLGWSITRVSPKKENDHCFLNYQFIQALNLGDEQIKELCQKTIDYFEYVSRDSIEYTLLYLLGKSTEVVDPLILDKLHDNVAKSLILNNDLIEDPYIKNSLVHSLNKKIKESYIGNLIIDGQYTMMVADPYAFMEHIFDLPVKGLLNRDEHYNKYWLDKGYRKIAAMRAPLTWRSEVCLLNLKENEETSEWYKYLNNCVIFNVFGIDNLLAGGADEDGDIICLTNNKQIIDGACGGLPVHYNTKKAPKVKIVEEELWKSDIKGFNSKVGFVTNCATSAFALLPLFEEGTPEHSEIIARLKRFRKEQGGTIDSTKGIVIKPFPIHWTKWKNISKCETKEAKDKANFDNSIVISKRPLFMRHVYSSYNKKYLDFRKRFNTDSRMRFDMPLDQMLQYYFDGNPLDDAQQKFISDYFRFIPFIQTNCLMNKLSAHMEKSVKELKESLKEKPGEKIIQILKDKSVEEDKETIKKVYDLYKKYKSEKQNFLKMKDEGSNRHNTSEQFNKYIRKESHKISANTTLLANCAVDICYVVHPSDNKSFVWNIFGNELVENVKRNRQELCFVPFKDPKGNIEYLGDIYSLYEVKISEGDDYEGL